MMTIFYYICTYNLNFNKYLVFLKISKYILILHFYFFFPLALDVITVREILILIRGVTSTLFFIMVTSTSKRIIKLPRASLGTKMIVRRFKWERNKSVCHRQYRLCKNRPSCYRKTIVRPLGRCLMSYRTRGTFLAAFSLTFSSHDR